MEWQQLEYFQKVAQLQHITKAANNLFITQPALSRSIGRLEEELGVPLFDRKGRSIYLNKYGKLFLQRVNKILSEYKFAREELDDLLKPDSGEIAIGFIHTLGSSLIPDLISKFRKKYPKTNFVLNQNSSKILLKELENTKMDFCFGSYFDINPELSYIDLFSEKLLVLAPKGHFLVEKNKLSIEDFKDIPLVSFKKGYAMRTLTENIFANHNIKPVFSFEGEDAHTIAGLVSSGLGVGIIPNIQISNKDKVVKLSIDNPEFMRTISFAWNENTYLSPIALKFKQFVIDYYSKIEN